MLKKTKKLIFTLSFLSLAVCAGAGFSALDGVFAGAETANADDLYITAGASVRTDEVVEDNEVVGYDTGIRFTANASASLINSLVETTGDTVTYKTGAELGMFIVPQSYMSDYTKYVKENGEIDYFGYFQSEKGKTKAQIAYTCNAEDLDAVNGTKYRVAIMELLEKNYTRAYQSVAYYTLNGVTYYTEPSDSRTVSQVIDSALQATDVPFVDGQKSAMAGILERAIELRTHAEGTGANALHTVAVHGDKTVNLKSRFYEITAPDIAFEIVSGDDVIAIEDGVVSALKSDSTAKVKVTAYNGLVDFDVTVRTPSLGETEVIDFAGASDLSLANITNEGDLNSITYLDEFQGAQGILKVDAKSWGRWGFDPLQSADKYTSAKYLVVRMWAEMASTAGYPYLGNGYEQEGNIPYTNVKSGCWLNYYFDASKFGWSDLGNYYSSLASYGAGVYYIDKIYVTDTLDVFEANTAFCITGGNGGWDATAEVVSEYKGAKDVVKITAKNWGVFTYSNLISMTECAKYTHIAMRIFVDSATESNIVTNNGNWIGYYGIEATRTPTVNGVWYDYYFDASHLTSLESWSSYDKAGIYFRYAGDYYIDSIYMTNNPETLTVLDFFNEDSTKYLVSGGWDITATEYLTEYQGAQGVMSITGSGSYAIQNFRHLANMNLAKNYTHFVIRAYADTTSNSSYIRLSYDTKYNDNYMQQAVETGVWKDYVFTREEFEYFWTNATYKGLRFGGAGTYYIDCMYFANL